MPARETGDSGHLENLCRPFHGLYHFLLRVNPGFRFAPPWALCFRLLRRLVGWLVPVRAQYSMYYQVTSPKPLLMPT